LDAFRTLNWVRIKNELKNLDFKEEAHAFEARASSMWAF